MSDEVRRQEEDFDWVDARAECSLTKMFVRLRSGAKRDVDARNAQLEGKRFGLTDTGPNSFAVFRETPTDQGRVDFECGEQGITIHRGEAIFSATITLNYAGVCRFVVNDNELYEWELRKRALEGLLFG